MILPPQSPPVSVVEDLGLVVPVAAPGATLCPGETLCHAIIKANTTAKPAIASIVAWVLPEILRWLRVFDAGAVCQCYGAWRARGLFLACALSERRRGVADSVASILSFETKLVQALRGPGASRRIILRAWACAWDWLDGLPRACLGFDERLRASVRRDGCGLPVVRECRRGCIRLRQ